MILIVGGAYQGKLNFAREEYGIAESDICNLEVEESIDLSKKLIYNLHEYIFRQIKQGNNPMDIIKAMDLKDKIIICDDITAGIVPIDSAERLWREETGKVLSYLSRESERVIRLFCGIETVIK